MLEEGLINNKINSERNLKQKLIISTELKSITNLISLAC